MEYPRVLVRDAAGRDLLLVEMHNGVLVPILLHRDSDGAVLDGLADEEAHTLHFQQSLDRVAELGVQDVDA